MFPNRLARAIHSPGSALDTGAALSPRDTRYAFKPERGFRAPDERRRKQILNLPGPGDLAQTRAPSALGWKPGTRAPGSACLKPQPLPELHFSSSLCGEQGANGSRTQDGPPCKAPAPRRVRTRACVAAPPGSHRSWKGAPSGPSEASQPLNCKQN